MLDALENKSKSVVTTVPINHCRNHSAFSLSSVIRWIVTATYLLKGHLALV